MKPFLKFGLIVGAVGLVIIVPISAFMGICGPGVTLMAGAVAGFLSAYLGKAATRREGAQSGAIAGSISGVMTLFGQILGGLIVLIFIQTSGIKPIFGTVPDTTAPASMNVMYYVSGLGAGLCFGIIGILLGAAAGGVAGAFGVRQTPNPVTPVKDIGRE